MSAARSFRRCHQRSNNLTNGEQGMCPALDELATKRWQVRWWPMSRLYRQMRANYRGVIELPALQCVSCGAGQTPSNARGRVIKVNLAVQAALGHLFHHDGAEPAPLRRRHGGPDGLRRSFRPVGPHCHHQVTPYTHNRSIQNSLLEEARCRHGSGALPRKS